MNRVITEVAAPDQGAKGVLFLRSCGAITKLKVGVSLLAPDEETPGETGNVFVADDTTLIPVGDRLREVSVHWNADGHLVVRYPMELRVQHQVVVYDGISVLYEPFYLIPDSSTVVNGDQES